MSSISIVELHPTFAAEVRGVDFSKEIPAEDFEQIQKAIAKVSHSSRVPGRTCLNAIAVWRRQISQYSAR